MPEARPGTTRKRANDFCREILPAVSRTFALSIRLLPGDLGASVHQEDDLLGLLEGIFGLVQNLARNILLILHDDTAGIDDLEGAPVVFGSPMDPVARDAGFVPDDGPALPCNPVEKSGLSYIGPAHDDYRGNGI